MKFKCPVKSDKKKIVEVTGEECRKCYEEQTETTKFCIHMVKYGIRAIKKGI